MKLTVLEHGPMIEVNLQAETAQEATQLLRMGTVEAGVSVTTYFSGPVARTDIYMWRPVNGRSSIGNHDKIVSRR